MKKTTSTVETSRHLQIRSINNYSRLIKDLKIVNIDLFYYNLMLIKILKNYLFE